MFSHSCVIFSDIGAIFQFAINAPSAAVRNDCNRSHLGSSPKRVLLSIWNLCSVCPCVSDRNKKQTNLDIWAGAATVGQLHFCIPQHHVLRIRLTILRRRAAITNALRILSLLKDGEKWCSSFTVCSSSDDAVGYWWITWRITNDSTNGYKTWKLAP